MKHLLKTTYRDVLPAGIVDRRDKMGFPVPLKEWFAGELKDFARDIFKGLHQRNRAFINADAVLENFETAGRFSRKTWALLSLELWQQMFHDRAAEYRIMLKEEANKSNTKILVTGCGQVGSHVAELLLARGDEVLVIENFATGQRGLPEQHSSLTIVEGSIADQVGGKGRGRFSTEALVPRLPRTRTPMIGTMTRSPTVWAGPTLFGCWLRRYRFIYFQTALCYGLKPLEQPITLGHPKLPANSSYAISKTAAEDYIEISGLDFVTFRLANVIGPRNVSGPLPIFTSAFRKENNASLHRRDVILSSSETTKYCCTRYRWRRRGLIISPRELMSPYVSCTMRSSKQWS